MSSMSNMARDAATGAREAARETAAAASSGARDIREDMEALRSDVTRLSQQIANIVTDKGSKVWTRARSNMEGVIADAQGAGREAVGAVREVGDHVVDAIDESIKTRPYTTLALAAGIGFLFGATWRR